MKVSDLTIVDPILQLSCLDVVHYTPPHHCKSTETYRDRFAFQVPFRTRHFNVSSTGADTSLSAPSVIVNASESRLRARSLANGS